MLGHTGILHCMITQIESDAIKHSYQFAVRLPVRQHVPVRGCVVILVASHDRQENGPRAIEDNVLYKSHNACIQATYR
jgi:hypothetical protein